MDMTDTSALAIAGMWQAFCGGGPAFSFAATPMFATMALLTGSS